MLGHVFGLTLKISVLPIPAPGWKTRSEQGFSYERESGSGMIFL
jgi:hypothetical protein